MNDRIYKTKREKYNAVIEEIVRLTEAGRPGTGRYDIRRNLRIVEPYAYYA